jgi:hypothetical protein
MQIQKSLENFDNLYQRVIDPDDAIILNKKIARCLCSKQYSNIVNVSNFKLDKCIFIGSMYDHRIALINKLKNTIEIDIIESVDSWQNYISILSNYKYVLSPNSYTANSFHLKFYESLLVDSIPIHQIYDNTLNYYPIEASYKDALYFKSADEIPDLIKNCNLEKSFNKPWLEDELIEFFKEDVII